MARVNRVNLVSYSQSRGLQQDIHLLAEVLADAGFRISVNNRAYSPRPGRPSGIRSAAAIAEKAFRSGILRRPVFDANIFLERVVPRTLRLARVNCFIPNPEWLRSEDRTWLPRSDLVLCKTRHAEQLFNRLGCRTTYTSFTSRDRLLPDRGNPAATFFHLAGNSLQKGTEAITSAWVQHPGWPPLTVVRSPRKGRPRVGRNISYVLKDIAEMELRNYQNSHRFHLCLSETEGFGHSLVEGMSCRAVVLATNAPPMCEMVASNRGILVDFQSAFHRGLATHYYVDLNDLEAKVELALTMTDDAKDRLGSNARDWFERNDMFFRQRIVEVMENL